MSLVDNGVCDETTMLRTISRAEGKQWRGHRFFRNEGMAAMTLTCSLQDKNLQLKRKFAY
jgi:hypothetical protein